MATSLLSPVHRHQYPKPVTGAHALPSGNGNPSDQHALDLKDLLEEHRVSPYTDATDAFALPDGTREFLRRHLPRILPASATWFFEVAILTLQSGMTFADCVAPYNKQDVRYTNKEERQSHMQSVLSPIAVQQVLFNLARSTPPPKLPNSALQRGLCRPYSTVASARICGQ